MSKKSYLLLSFIFGPLLWVVLSATISNLFAQNAVCYANYVGWCGYVSSAIDYVGPFMSLFIFLFLASLVIYFLPDRIFRAWSRFALVWIPLSMIAIALSPEYGSGWMSIYAITKGFVAFATSMLFCAISLLIILGAWFLRSKKS